MIAQRRTASQTLLVLGTTAVISSGVGPSEDGVLTN